MKEIINSILAAEEMAEQIVLDATEKAKGNAMKADTESEKKRQDAVRAFNDERKAALKDAEKKARAEYDKIMSGAEELARDMTEKAKVKIEETADALVKSLLK